MTYKTLKNINNLLFLMIFAILFANPVTSSAQNPDELWIYVQNDRASQVKSLLDRGLDPNSRTGLGNPILMQAVRDDSWAVFDLILEQPGTEINILNGYQETPLMYVSIVGDLNRAKRLVAKGAEFNHLGWTPLHYAASKGHVDIVKYLLSIGAMPNAPAPDGTSPIMMAARSGSLDAVQVLLNAGADPAAININGENAVTSARDNGHTTLAESLSKVIAKRNQQ